MRRRRHGAHTTPRPEASAAHGGAMLGRVPEMGAGRAAAGGGLALIWAAYWAVGDALSLRAEGDMIGSLMWLGLLVLLYPPGLVVLVLDLRDGLRAAREWRAMPEAERTAALERQAAEAPPARKRRTKRRGEGAR